jgi:hypothetical protein
VDTGVAAPTGDKRTIDRKGRPEGDEQPDTQAPPEEEVAEAGLRRPGHEQDEAVVDAMTKSRTSPIAQPVRQCQVAAKAVRFSDSGASR